MQYQAAISTNSYGLNCVHQNLHVQILILVSQTVAVFGDGVFKEMIKLNQSHKCRALRQYNIRRVIWDADMYKGKTM